MVRLAALCLLLLLLPTSSFQNAAQETLGARPPPPRLLQELLGHQHPTRLEAQRSHPPVDMDPTRLGLFVAAATGTLALMAAVYCVYNRFYTRRRYLHGRLSEEPDVTSDPLGSSPVVFHSSSGYGALADSPSVISVPPSLSPPLSAMPFPPLFLSPSSLRTISARDLEKGCI